MTILKGLSKYVFDGFFSNWRRGRVARQRSAKPSTAVRIRSTPQTNLQVFLGGFFYDKFLEKILYLDSRFHFDSAQ